MVGKSRSQKRNLQLVRAREEMGLTAKDFAKKAKISYGEYLRYENSGKRPFGAKKELLRGAKKICDYHALSPSHFWPNYCFATEIEVAGEIFEERQIIPNPEEILSTRGMQDAIRQALATLTPREEKILRMHFGIGEETDSSANGSFQNFMVTRTRIRQIEAKALRKLALCKLRHPSKSRILGQFF